MKDRVFDCLLEKKRKILRLLYPLYFLIILMLIGSIYIKDIFIICVMGVIFILFSILFFKTLINIIRMNDYQMYNDNKKEKKK